MVHGSWLQVHGAWLMAASGPGAGPGLAPSLGHEAGAMSHEPLINLYNPWVAMSRNLQGIGCVLAAAFGSFFVSPTCFVLFRCKSFKVGFP